MGEECHRTGDVKLRQEVDRRPIEATEKPVDPFRLRDEQLVTTNAIRRPYRLASVGKPDRRESRTVWVPPTEVPAELRHHGSVSSTWRIERTAHAHRTRTWSQAIE